MKCGGKNTLKQDLLIMSHNLCDKRKSQLLYYCDKDI